MGQRMEQRDYAGTATRATASTRNMAAPADGGLGHATRSPFPVPCSPRRAFTLAELMVATGILAIMILGIGVVFRSASRAAGITAADTDVIEAWGVVDAALREELANHLDTPEGLLIIHSELADVAEGRIGTNPVGVARPTRADRLAFVARGQYESATAREMRVTVNGKNIATAVSADAALVYYGHGLPAGFNAAENLYDLSLPPRAEWVLCRRATLLGLPPSVPGEVDYPDVLPLGANPPAFLLPGPEPALPISNEANPLFNLVNNRIDGVDADLPVFLLWMVDPTDSDGDGFPDDPCLPPAHDALNANQNLQGVCYMRPRVPRRVTAGTYRRAFPVMLENVGDFIVEWTDGSVVDPRDQFLADGVTPGQDGVPDDPRVQWFGMPRDADGDQAVTFPNTMPPPPDIARTADTVPKSVWLGGPDGDVSTTGDNFGTAREMAAYWGDPLGARDALAIEQWTSGTDVYHASWFSNKCPSDYEHRPTAFRIIVRLYDAELRVGAADRDRTANTDHYGSMYTIVAP